MPALDYTRLADLYDTYVDVTEDLGFWRAVVRGSPGPILELMAGTGRVSLPLLTDGAPLVATDLVPDMLAVLGRKLAAEGRSTPRVCCDARALAFAAARFPLVLLPFQGFSEITGTVSQRRLLQAVRRVLTPGGRFVCTLHNPAARRTALDGVWREVRRVPAPGAGGGEVVVSIRASLDPATHTVAGTQRLDRIDAAGRRIERRSLPLRFSLVPPERFRELARAAGFAVETLHGDYRRSPYREEASPVMIWTLQAA
jgi:SAM-dependent methyltransferase